VRPHLRAPVANNTGHRVDVIVANTADAYSFVATIVKLPVDDVAL
jgi:hypothetical protein